MSNANLGWSVNDKEVLQSFQKLQAEIDKLKTKSEQLANSTKKAGKDGIDSFGAFGNVLDDGVASLQSMVLGLASVGTAVSLVRSEWDDWRNQIQQVAQRSSEFTDQLVRDLRKTGEIARANEISTALRGIRGVTPAQGEAIFAGLGEAGPGLSIERRLALTQQLAPAAQMGATADELRTFAQAMGELADANPGKTADDVADMGTKMQQLARGDFAKFAEPGTLRSLAKLSNVQSMEETMGMLAVAMDANMSSRTLEKMANEIGKPQELRKAKRRKPLSEEDKAFNTFAAATDREQLNMLLTRPDIANAVMGDQAQSLALIKPELVAQRAQEFRQAQRANLAQSELAKARATTPGAMVALSQGGEAARDALPSGQVGAEEIIARIDPRLQAAGMTWSQRSAIAGRIRSRVAVGGEAAQSALVQLEPLPQTRGETGGWFGTSRTLTTEEKQNWTEMIALLRTIAQNQKAGKTTKDINQNVE